MLYLDLGLGINPGGAEEEPDHKAFCSNSAQRIENSSRPEPMKRQLSWTGWDGMAWVGLGRVKGKPRAGMGSRSGAIGTH